jgi:hypothetical protein
VGAILQHLVDIGEAENTRSVVPFLGFSILATIIIVVASSAEMKTAIIAVRLAMQ